MKTYPITLYPERRVLNLSEGTNLFEELRRHGVYIYNACGGGAKCGKCKVRLMKDSFAPHHTSEETECFTPQEITQGFRLSCCIKVAGPMELEILKPEVQAKSQPTDSYLPSISCRPTVEKSLINITPPSLKDNASYLKRIEEAAGVAFHPWYIKQNLTRICPLFRKSASKFTAILIDRQLTLLEPGDTKAACYAMAVDIGTTMLDASLVDLNLGQEVDALSVPNPQLAYGIDVLSRISSCQGNEVKVKKLQHLIVEEINSLVNQFAARLDIKQESVYQLAIAGNTTMLHLFAGVDPRTIGRAPYVPIFSCELRFRPADCGIEISPGGEVILLPSISAYIGADIVAGMLATKLGGSNEPTIFIDMGTNGEVALSSAGKLLATSCAAGPALEGMNISCGMQAMPGAIERVFFDRKIEFRTIGGLVPQGLCGSAVIDLAAEMVRHKVVDKRGKFANRETLLQSEHPWLAECLTEIKEKPAFVLYQDKKHQIYFSQADFRQIQLARGAICSAIEVLLTEAGLRIGDIRRFIVAGRFGKSIRAGSFKHLGIIPGEFSGRIDYVGNSSRAGAMMVLINSSYREKAKKLCQQVKTIELSTYPGYERILAKHLVF